MSCTHSPVVRVTRRCLLRRQWTAVDFSACTLSSAEEQTFLVISLWAFVADTSPDQVLALVNVSILEEKVCPQALTVNLSVIFMVLNLVLSWETAHFTYVVQYNLHLVSSLGIISMLHICTYSQQLTSLTVSSEESMPESTSLSLAMLNQYVILVYKIFFSSQQAALTLNLNSISRSLICMQPEIALGNDLQLRIEDGNVEAFVRSGM